MSDDTVATEFYSALIIGACPTAAMIVATFLLTKVEVDIKIEAALQNFAAGLIIAAVAAELFPIMVDSSENASYLGISVGFAFGLGLIYGLEHLVGHLEENDGQLCPSKQHDHSAHSVVHPIKTYPKGFQPLSVNGDVEMNELMKQVNSEGWHDDAVAHSSKLLNSPAHRGHIQEHLNELSELLKTMENSSTELQNPNISTRECEHIAEFMDEKVHVLQYKLDHTRRLLQGTETTSENNTSSNNLTALHTVGQQQSAWFNEERKQEIVSDVAGLRNTIDHLLEHISEPELDKSVVKEMRIHMEYMDKQIAKFHHSIENVTERWHRSLPKIEVHEGDKLPMGLVVPVFMDAMTDGFLLGISTTISLKAGIILSFANCLEMSFLGMAYASRLVKCTGSSFWVRFAALYGPPLLMFLTAGLGGVIGGAVQNITALYVAMVAFGSVALLFLVTNELLIEARESQGEDNKWYISIMVFAGIYIVLMLNHVL